MALTIGTQLGSHEITALLGKGGMGEVYRARDLKLKREVAIKVLPEDFSRDADRVSRFQREAELLASLNHPNIAGIYDVRQDGDSRFLVLELVEGETLADKISNGPIRVEEALNIAKQIAEALEAAHERGIIHRDLKPANIKVTPEGKVKVLDFGLAKALESSPAGATLSNSPTMVSATGGVIIGTAAYMSPEQARGKRIDKRADIWAFGVVLWEMLTGKQLFQGETITDVLAAVVRHEPEWERVPTKIRRLLRRCLEKDPAKRLRDIGDAWELLEDQNLMQHAPAIPKRRNVLYLIAIAILAAATVALSFVHFRETVPPERVLRYTIPLPENTALHSFALSPDGRYVAIVATRNNERQLWLRPLDALEAQPMPGTEDAAYPFWSPDSRWIGFFAQQRLKKIAVGGGPPQTLCDTGTNGTGGTWSQDDVILFAGSPVQRMIRRCSASGGDTSDVLKADDNALFPVFMPDGRHFLYMRSLLSQTGGIYLASLDGKENRRVIADAWGVAFASKPASSGGAILFLRENNLLALPFDARTGQTAGDAKVVAESVSRPSGVAVSAANDVLAYWRGPIGSNQIVWYDRTGKVLEKVSAPGDVWEPSISPDGKTIAFARFTGAISDIWLRDEHGVDQRFTTDASRNDTPIWSPNGERIVFRSNRSGQQEIWLKPVNGGGKEELLPTDNNTKFATQWTRDGRFIVYSDNSPGTSIDLWFVPTEGDRKPAKFLQTNFSESEGQISPDGHWMTYASNQTGRREVYVAQFPSAERQLRISTGGGEQPRWRGDGKELFYVAADGKMMSVAVKTAEGDKPVFNHGSPVALFETRIAFALDTRAFQYDVAADGNRFLVATNAATTSAAGPTPPLTVELNWASRLKK